MAGIGRLSRVLLGCPLPLSEKQAEVRNKQARAEVASFGVVRVRTLAPGEAMPQHLSTGFEHMAVMNDFVWVAEKDKKIVGILLAAPCHGLIFFVRVRTVEDAPHVTAHLLFRNCVRDSLARGFQGFFTYIDPSLKAERHFISIVLRAGGIKIESPQVGLVGNLESAARF